MTAGDFTLESIGDDPLPVPLSGAIVVVSQSLTLRADGTMISEGVIRNLTAGAPDIEATIADSGTWSQSGSRIIVSGTQTTMTLRMEEGGNRLRSEGASSMGPGLDILRIHVYRREF